MIEIKKNSFNRITVQKCIFRGAEFIDIRNYFRNYENEFKPSKKGISVPLDKVEDLIQALQELNAEQEKLQGEFDIEPEFA